MNSLTSKLKSTIGILTFVALTGCSTLQIAPELELGEWSFKGKMAVRSAEEASSFSVNWLQQGANYDIELFGPLGQGAVTIRGDQNQAILSQGDKTLESNNLSNLVWEATQLDLPLDHLQYWVRALPSPFETYTLLKNDAGQTTQITQAGWTVNITAYFEASDNPRKLNFARSTDNGKLVIREWQLADPQSN
jgi:outer membrane lipoprotein LolB